MNCPVCGEATRVKSSLGDCEMTTRKRQCLACQQVFYTTEIESNDSKSDFFRFQAEKSAEYRIKGER